VRSRADYQRARRKLLQDLYFRSEADFTTYKGMAREAGSPTFNSWLLYMIELAASGSAHDPTHVTSIEEKADRYRAWLEQAREEVAELRAETKALQLARDDLQLLLVALVEPGGALVGSLFSGE
jgi:hypothetical protein